MKKFLAQTLPAFMALSMLASCSSDSGSTGGTSSSGGTSSNSGSSDSSSSSSSSADGTLNLSVCIASEPQTIDPALNSSVDGAVMAQHFFEGLFKWSDSGSKMADGINAAELEYGQITGYDKEETGDGGAIYTFHLRDDIFWSDGVEVVAGDFVYAWQRLATPTTAADYCYMIDMVKGYSDVMDNGADPSTLAVSAPDDKTFVVEVAVDSPYFLEVCAFPATLPVREDIITEHGDQWTFSPETYVGNGAYKMSEWVHNASITAVQNEQYYDVENLGPETITFMLMDDTNAMLSAYNSGQLQFIQDAPVDEIPALMVSGEMDIVDYIGTYYISYQVENAPFDDWRVRKAFTLAIDSQYIVDKVTQTGQVPAGGFVPAGIYDADGATGDDFRTTGGDYWDLPTSAEIYAANLEEANQLLDDAGYGDRSTFPVTEYLYNTNDNHKAIAEALQNMWSEGLGVTVTLSNQDWSVFLETRKTGDYQIARNGWIADYNDPTSFLDMWMTDGGNNDAQYASAEYDALINSAKSTSDVDLRMDYLHQAEDLIIGEDWVLGPIYFYTQQMMLKEDLQGVYYTPLGYYFFDYVTPVS